MSSGKILKINPTTSNTSKKQHLSIYNRSLTCSKISNFFISTNQTRAKNGGRTLSHKKYRGLIESLASVIKLEAISMLDDDLKANSSSRKFQTYSSPTSKFFPIETSWGQLSMYSNGFDKDSWNSLDDEVRRRYKKETLQEVKDLEEFGLFIGYAHLSRSKQRIKVNRSVISFAKYIHTAAEVAPKELNPAPFATTNTAKSQSSDFQRVSDVIAGIQPPSCNELNILNLNKKENTRNKAADVSNQPFGNENQTSLEPCVVKPVDKCNEKQKNNSAAPQIEIPKTPVIATFLEKYLKNFSEKGNRVQKFYDIDLPAAQIPRYAVLLWKNIVDNFYTGVKINKEFNKLAAFQHQNGLLLMENWVRAEIASGLKPAQAFLKLNWCIAKLTHNRIYAGKTYVYGPKLTFALTPQIEKGSFFRVVNKEYPMHLAKQNDYPLHNEKIKLEGYGEINIHRGADRLLKLMKRNRVFDIKKIHLLENNLDEYLQILQNKKFSAYNVKQNLLRYTDFWTQIKLEKLLIEVEKNTGLQTKKMAAYITKNVEAYGRILDRIGCDASEISEKQAIFTQQFSFIFQNQK